MMRIEAITLKDFTSIKRLQPEGWSDIMVYLNFYLTSPQCFPIKALVKYEVAGIGAIIFHETTAWLAHIIVHPDFRNRGIGGGITQALVKQAESKSVRTVFLIATKAGEPVYKKLSFEVETEYVLFNDGPTFIDTHDDIKLYQPSFKKSLLKLDYEISGEKRIAILEPHLSYARVVLNNNVMDGFYLPTLGEGLIVANEVDAGIALLKLKHSKEAKTGLPVQNLAGCELLIKQGFKEIFHGKRMRLGQPLHYKPQKLYSRIGGNLG